MHKGVLQAAIPFRVLLFSQCLPLPQAGGVLGLCSAREAAGQRCSPASLCLWMGWDLLAELSGVAGALKYPTEERNNCEFKPWR